MSALQWIALGVIGIAGCVACWWGGFLAGRIQGAMDVCDELERSRAERAA